jgi:ABC-type transport system involved in multi-copper enzyme maturation permease subunit
LVEFLTGSSAALPAGATRQYEYCDECGNPELGDMLNSQSSSLSSTRLTLSPKRIWDVARYELTWDLRKKRTYIVTGLFVFAAFVFSYLEPAIAGKSITTGPTQLGISFGSDLWWVNVHYLAFNIFVSGLFPLLIGGFIAADAIASEFDNRTIVPLLSQPVRRLEVYAGKLLEKVLFLLVMSTLFTLLVIAGSEVSVGPQSHLDMIPLVVFAEYGAFLEYAALAFLIGSLVRSGTMVLGVLTTLFILILGTVLVLSLQFGEQEVMFLFPVANADFLLKVVPYYVFQPFGVMVLQGNMLQALTLPTTVTVISALEYVVAGLLVNLLAAFVAGYYFFRRAEVKS